MQTICWICVRGTHLPLLSQLCGGSSTSSPRSIDNLATCRIFISPAYLLRLSLRCVIRSSPSSETSCSLYSPYSPSHLVQPVQKQNSSSSWSHSTTSVLILSLFLSPYRWAEVKAQTSDSSCDPRPIEAVASLSAFADQHSPYPCPCLRTSPWRFDPDELAVA